MNKSKRGFTIIELLVVLAIIGVITVLVFQQVTNARAKQRDQERVQDINVINANFQELWSSGQSLNGANITSFVCGGTLLCETLRDPQAAAGVSDYYMNDTVTGTGTVFTTTTATTISATGNGLCARLERGTSITQGNGIFVIRYTGGAATGQFAYCARGQ
ncbi:MAG: type II secretion system protein [Parcubacteria group bacterium]|nr:type II secretion system protein [Parcubacteria group bacterium]